MLIPRPYFFLPIALAVIYAVAAPAADTAICDATGGGATLEAVEASTKDARCAVSDDFRRSCAYRDFLQNERKKSIGEVSKVLGERFGRVFDAAATFEKGESSYREIQSAALMPNFLKIFDYWDLLKRPERSSYGRYSESLTSQFSQTELEKFYRAIYLIRILDPTGVFLSSIGLLATLPEEVRRDSTPSERTALITKVFADGFAYQNSHSAGCATFRASLGEGGGGLTAFGPVFRNGQRRENYPEERKAALEASKSAMGTLRSVAGMTEKLRACGDAHADVRTAVRLITRSCDVDLPVMEFADNEADLDSEKKQKLVDAIAKDPCYQKSIREGLKVQKVAIATSANTLHNTKNYCKREFDRLSAERAKTVQNAVTPFFVEKSVTFQVDSRGSRGDGSSGPCAYFAKEVSKASDETFEIEETSDGVKRVRHFLEKRDPKYATTSGEKLLDGFKYARTTIYFEDRSTPIDSNSSQWSAITRCRNVQFKCD